MGGRNSQEQKENPPTSTPSPPPPISTYATDASDLKQKDPLCDVKETQLPPPAYAPQGAEDLPFIQQRAADLTSPSAFYLRSVQCLEVEGALRKAESGLLKATEAEARMREALADPDGEVGQVVREMGWPCSDQSLAAIQTSITAIQKSLATITKTNVRQTIDQIHTLGPGTQGIATIPGFPELVASLEAWMAGAPLPPAPPQEGSDSSPSFDAIMSAKNKSHRSLLISAAKARKIAESIPLNEEVARGYRDRTGGLPRLVFTPVQRAVARSTLDTGLPLAYQSLKEMVDGAAGGSPIPVEEVWSLVQDMAGIEAWMRQREGGKDSCFKAASAPRPPLMEGEGEGEGKEGKEGNTTTTIAEEKAEPANGAMAMDGAAPQEAMGGKSQKISNQPSPLPETSPSPPSFGEESFTCAIGALALPPRRMEDGKQESKWDEARLPDMPCVPLHFPEVPTHEELGEEPQEEHLQVDLESASQPL